VAHQERVHSLVLANVGPQRIESSDAYADRDPATLEEFYRLRYTPFFRERANRRLFQPQFTPITAENVLEFPDRIMRDFAEHNPIGNLEHVLCPTLVIHGELDPIPEEFARLLVARIPDARYVRINGASHFAFLKDTGLFIEAVEPFLSEQL
jgi:pimeloyl-ACP methyl ester carboxylesterase